MRIWDFRQGGGDGPVGRIAALREPVFCLAAAFESHRVLSGSGDTTDTVAGWDLRKLTEQAPQGGGGGAKVFTLRRHHDSVWSIAADGRRIVSGSVDTTLKCWNETTLKCRHTLRGHIEPVLCCAFDDMQIVSGAADSLVVMWDFLSPAGSGEHMAEWLQAHRSARGKYQAADDVALRASSAPAYRGRPAVGIGRAGSGMGLTSFD